MTIVITLMKIKIWIQATSGIDFVMVYDLNFMIPYPPSLAVWFQITIA